jgi:hypothetical protein
VGIVRRQVRRVVVAGAVIAGGMVVARVLGYRLGRDTVVRCRQGHLFTTVWIPGVKLKAIDLGVARVQRCPVGQHWSLVTPVREATLSPAELRFAHEHHDVLIP